MSFEFTPYSQPFPRWWGPFSPARGTTTGFRFHGGLLGTWVEDDDTRGFWTIKRSTGLAKLEKLVLERYRGGRVLLLPNGTVVKPLQRDDERGKRVYIGEFSGDVILETPDGNEFSLESPGALKPGGRWTGPRSTGLECVIQKNGALECTWYHPVALGRDTESRQMIGPSAALARGFRLARGVDVGRVRVTAKGHVITNRKVGQEWQCFYVGSIDPASWPHLEEWIDDE
jgi:hypothetical protein